MRATPGTHTRTRRALVSLAGSGAALALAACGQTAGGGAPSAGESAGARPASAPALSGTVRFTFFGTAEEKPVWDKISEQFGRPHAGRPGHPGARPGAVLHQDHRRRRRGRFRRT